MGQNVWLYSCTLDNNTTVFKPDGGANSSGNMMASSSQGGERADIDVLASTGRVKLAFRQTKS
ncbi:MAG: hypothetical protein KAW02_06580 [candidate division Zixibacteria bacterium]|nr:hypothetical protein [candidate division Zixibacteria bacterium]